jgi:hypothetical protein
MRYEIGSFLLTVFRGGKLRFNKHRGRLGIGTPCKAIAS